MKKSAILILILFPFIATGQLRTKENYYTVKDVMSSSDPYSVRINGYLGEKINLVISKRIKAQDVDHLVEPFRHKNETRLWQTEFWGKWILSAIEAYRYNHDLELLKIIKDAATSLMATQTAEGYIGNYSEEASLQQWDIWGRKYTLLGLLSYYDLTGDKDALNASKRLADHLLTQVGPGKINIVKTGNYRGMTSCSILEPMVFLYRHTGEKRYLDFAEYIVEQWETADGPKLISAGLSEVPVAERFPHPAEWWSYENGQKAYEMMSCYDGLLELYRITGNESYILSVEKAVRNIIVSEINIAGSGSAFECWYNGAKYQAEPTYHTMETCVTMTWMKLCNNLLRITGKSLYADEIEKSAYNALLASFKYDGSQIAKYSPLGGVRHSGEEQCGMHINCCNANGPRAFMMLPGTAVMSAQNNIYINMYGDIESTIPVNQKNKVKISQVSDYPATDIIEITIDPDKSEKFSISLRIPAWSKLTSLSVNGEDTGETIPGDYKKIARTWNKGDKIRLKLDLRGRMTKINNCQALLRGPVVLARDTRFNDGFIAETSVVKEKDGFVELQAVKDLPGNIWMGFTAPMILGTDLEGEFSNPRPVNFCDFASAGNTWNEESRYRVWIPATLNVMQMDYKGY